MPEQKFAVDICLCTFRRAHVVETLRSIAQLVLDPSLTIRVIVADNDESPTGSGLVHQAARDFGLEVLYLHAPAGNISVARNACLDAATAPLVAFIDDDERADPGWLAGLVAAMDDSRADVVLGPVRAVYDEADPGWMVAGDFHSTRPVWVGGEIRTGYTSNVLFRRLAPALAGRRFHHGLGQAGEDTMFFSEVYQAGGTIAYAAEAWVTEAVAASRANLRWLLARRFKNGQTHALVLMETADAGVAMRIGWVGAAVGKAGFCAVLAVLNCAHKERFQHWLLRGTLHCGVAARLLMALAPAGETSTV